MYLNLRAPGRRSRAAAGMAVVIVTAGGALGLLSACGQSSHSPAAGAGALTPGPGETGRCCSSPSGR
ncbi:hypothetical protein SCANM63S_05518 [Streptomyces canarius]